MDKGFIIKDGILTGYEGEESALAIPEGVTEIGEGAFSFCKNLEEITIPASVKRIGSSAFAYCDKLEKVVFKGDPKDIDVQGRRFLGLALRRGDGGQDIKRHLP